MYYIHKHINTVYKLRYIPKTSLSRGRFRLKQNVNASKSSFLTANPKTEFPWDESGIFTYMGVSENRGTPKWMVYNGKHY